MQEISDIEAITQMMDTVCSDELTSQSSTVSQHSVVATAYPASEDDHESFDARLLRALATMAVRSKRRQADLNAALFRAGLSVEISVVSATLSALELAGFIENIVPLYDGGLLMSVTTRGIEQLHTMPRWAIAERGGVCN